MLRSSSNRITKQDAHINTSRDAASSRAGDESGPKHLTRSNLAGEAADRNSQVHRLGWKALHNLYIQDKPKQREKKKGSRSSARLGQSCCRTRPRWNAACLKWQLRETRGCGTAGCTGPWPSQKQCVLYSVDRACLVSTDAGTGATWTRRYVIHWGLLGNMEAQFQPWAWMYESCSHPLWSTDD